MEWATCAHRKGDTLSLDKHSQSCRSTFLFCLVERPSGLWVPFKKAVFPPCGLVLEGRPHCDPVLYPAPVSFPSRG